MKIYNEIVINMNPESSSYGETLHEDSYEYEGDMILMQSEGEVYYTKVSSGNARTGYDYTPYTYTNGAWVAGAVVTQRTDPGGGIIVGSTSEIPNYGLSTETAAGFTWTGDEPDPTSEEFRQSVQKTGGFDDLATLYGQDPMNFDEFYGAPLDYAKEQYGTGKQALSSQTGKSLGDIYSQTEQAEVESGFESSGAIDYTKTKATKGVMGDYLNQQQQLSSQLAMTTEDFWKTTEDQFYAEMEENIAAG